jgi:hypothetical protein
MSRDKLIYAGVIVLAVLGFLVFKQSQKDQQIGKPKAALELPSINAPDDIDKISIKDGTKGEIVLQKEGDKWMLVQPVRAAANAATVKDAVSNLVGLKVDRESGLRLDDEVRKSKKLDPEQAMHVVAWKGAELKTDLFFGANMLAVKADKPEFAWIVKGYSSWIFAREPKDWRDKEIFKFEDANASQISLINRAGEFSFTKGEKGWAASFKGKELERLDEDRVKDLLRELKGLIAEDFGDGKLPAETGLDAPEATVVVTLKDNAGKYTLRLGKVSGAGPARFALRDGNDTIFVVGKFAGEWLLAEVTKFQKIVDAGADAAHDAAVKPRPAP